jgi:hypothetical protein
MRLDSLEQLACLGVPWQVEPQIGLTAFVVESVASKAVVGQNRPHFFLKINPRGWLKGSQLICAADRHNHRRENPEGFQPHKALPRCEE